MKLWKKFSLLAAVVLLMTSWRPLLAIVVNALSDFVEIGSPASPVAGIGRIYFDSTGHLLSSKNSSGAITHTVATSACSGGTPVVGNINADGTVTCAASGGGGGGFIQALTAPVSGNFSPINFSGSGVTTTQVNGTTPVTYITLRQQDPTHTGNLAAISKAKIAATFTITEAFSISGDVNAGTKAGIWLNDSGTNSLFFCIYQSPNNDGAFYPEIFSATSFNNAGSGGANVFAPGGNGGPYGPLIWFRVQETVSARNYYMSSDGATFYLIFTESNTANLTTANYGMGIFYFNGGGQTYDGGITLYSFSETNP